MGLRLMGGCLLMVTIFSPVTLARTSAARVITPPEVSSKRRNPRMHSGQLGIAYTREAFVRQAGEGVTLAVEL